MAEAFIPLGEFGVVPDTVRETLAEVQARNFKIPEELLPEVRERDHMCRPYPGGEFDLLTINVPSTYQQGLIPDGEEAPHGLLRVVTAANDLHETKPLYPALNAGLLDAHRLRLQPQEIIDEVVKTSTQVVGLNPTSVNVPEAQAIAQLCDEAGVPYILGGIHATLDPTIARNDFPNAAAIIRGTGELVIGPVIQSILAGQRPATPGVYWPDSDHSALTRTKDIEPGDIPLVRQDKLVEAPVYEHTVVINGRRRVINEANLFVTYGCPFECTFCSSPVLVGRNERTGKPAYRRPDMERIMDDVEHVVEGLGANAIHFLDDMAFVSAKNIAEFHKSSKRRELMGRFIWRGLTRAPVINRFSDETLGQMQETGAWKIALGVESGSDEILKQIKKKVKVADTIEAVARLSMAGIQTKGFFIFGFPGETEDQMQETRGLITKLKGLGMTEISAFQFKPYPGTEAYAQIMAINPDLAADLSYLRRDSTEEGGKASARATDTPWLPDEVQIAAVPSGRVREHVKDALRDFYGSAQDETVSCS
jgi:radical SAM superfamily enzyme YgiQ (UPF0313 family)